MYLSMFPNSRGVISEYFINTHKTNNYDNKVRYVWRIFYTYDNIVIYFLNKMISRAIVKNIFGCSGLKIFK